MTLIPKELIEEIRKKADIVQVVSEYVQLRKRGKNHLGLCPFHAEKDGSFTVSPDKQIFHCFGCNQGGNVFSFLMAIENITFIEAVYELGNKYGITLPQRSGPASSKSERDHYYQALTLAAKFFQQSLIEGSLTYLEKRGISQETIKKFGLGYAPAGWDNLFNNLLSRGVSPEVMVKVGLALPRDGANGCYDRFRNRIIFPIQDHRGQLVAFGGRAMGDEEPKYLNSADSVVYSKGGTLFGLNHSKDSSKQQKTTILVEGYFDLITPFQNGFTNIVATLGTALTAEQAKLLSRYAQTVILAFDADSAGGTAAERAIALFKQHDLIVKVARFSGGKDPDEIINKLGAEKFREMIDAALPQLEFKLRRLLDRYNLKEIESRSQALKATVKLLAEEKDPFVQKEYAKIAASLLKTDPESIMTEIRRNTSYPTGSSNLRWQTEKPTTRSAEAERTIVALLLQNPDLLPEVKGRFSPDDFRLPETTAALNLLFQGVSAEQVVDQLNRELAALLVSQEIPAEAARQAEIFKDCLNVLAKEEQQKKIGNIKQEISAAEQAGETEKVAQLLSVIRSEIF